jgi:hypothetical protein
MPFALLDMDGLPAASTVLPNRTIHMLFDLIRGLPGDLSRDESEVSDVAVTTCHLG